MLRQQEPGQQEPGQQEPGQQEPGQQEPGQTCVPQEQLVLRQQERLHEPQDAQAGQGRLSGEPPPEPERGRSPGPHAGAEDPQQAGARPQACSSPGAPEPGSHLALRRPPQVRMPLRSRRHHRVFPRRHPAREEPPQEAAARWEAPSLSRHARPSSGRGPPGRPLSRRSGSSRQCRATHTDRALPCWKCPARERARRRGFSSAPGRGVLFPSYVR